MEPTELAVIGAGPGGYVAALRAAQLGLKVVLIERDKTGGTCLHRGCIPSKALIHGARVFQTVQKAAEFGIELSGAPGLNYGVLAARKDKTVSQLEKGVEFLLQKRGVSVIKGDAAFHDSRSLKITAPDGSQQTLGFGYCIIATGGVPTQLPGYPLDGKVFVTSNEVLQWTALPKSIVIIGAGVIGCEFASLFARVGVSVRVIEMMPQVLPGFDGDVSREIGRALKKQGVDVLLETKIESAAVVDGRAQLMLAGIAGVPPASGSEKIDADVCIIAVGRKPETSGLKIECAGLAANAKGAIDVDEHCRTKAPGIYAIGDVTGVAPLAHVASHMGIVAAEQIAGGARGGRNLTFDKSLAPWAVFTEPEVASIGLSEEKARESGREIKAGKFSFRALGRAQATGEYEGFVKIISDAKSGALIGFHAVGSEATNLLGEAALAWTSEARVEELAETIHAHPTFPEAVGEAALAALGRGIHSL
ncbi:MAG TPA: dihydrolipoyl dehydrogenase [Planctomycetota bacterium]|nr:dihydrolipoyl dehydrogenase [Planctomycetota bacterium]